MRKYTRFTTQTNEAQRKHLETMFRTRFTSLTGAYAQVNISQVRVSRDGNTIFAQFSGEGETYCLNKGGNHTGNRVYGQVDRQQACVRCHCTCVNKPRKSGRPCKEFASPPSQLTPADRLILFGADPPSSKKAAPSFLKQSADQYLEQMSNQLFGDA